MAPLILLVASFLLLRVAGALGVRALAGWVIPARLAVASMFLLTASAHFGSRRPDLVRMVPPGLGDPELLVTLTGIAELLGAAALLVPRTSRLAAVALALLLVALFPANVRAAREGLTIGGVPATPLVPRAILQVVFIGATLAAGFGPRAGVRTRRVAGRKGVADPRGGARGH
jgi:uncharacterized membrane protein